MHYPATFLDLDGTLVGHTGEVAPEVWSALDKARDSGLVLSVCTGRPSGGIASVIAQRIGPQGPHCLTRNTSKCWAFLASPPTSTLWRRRVPRPS